MKLTTKDVIKIIPLENSLRERLLAEYDHMDLDQRTEIEQTVWLTYDSIRQMRLEENLREALEHLDTNENNVSPEFFQEIKRKTDEELTSEGMEDVKTEDLNQARKALEDILKQKNSNSDVN